MRTIPKGEKATINMSVDLGDDDTPKKLVTMTFTAREDKHQDTRTEMTWIMDFGDCSMTELLLEAAKSTKISYVPNWREAKDRMDAEVWDNRTINVKTDILDAGKTPRDPVKATSSLLNKLSYDQLYGILIDKGMGVDDAEKLAVVLAKKQDR